MTISNDGTDWRGIFRAAVRAKHFTRKLDAERHLVLVQHQLPSGTYVTPEAGRVTLGAFADVYLARQPWRPSTGVAAGKALVHIRRTFGDRPLSSIRKGDRAGVPAST